MAPVIVDPGKVHEFADAASFYDWLAGHHQDADEVWIKIHKLRSGLPSINPAQAIEVALCWGWIDAIRKGFDDRSFLQRYSRRGARSTWSQINVESVGRLITEGRMTSYGLVAVDAAKVDSRWDRAYGSGKDMKIPADLQAAIEAEPAALSMLGRLTEQNRFAIAFQTHNMKTEVGRKRKIETIVTMLMNEQTVYPQRR